ncbi:MAG: DedA family protein [Nitrospirota bacterium]
MLTFLEGESVLIAAGFLAHSNYLNVYGVILVAAMASYIGHSTFFLIAFHRREAFINFTRKIIKVNLSRLESLMAKYGIASIFISQWIYGFRLLSAAVLGLSRMGKKTYFTYAFISCLIWAIVCTYVGYFFGVTLKNAIGDIKKYEFYIVAGILIAGFLIWLVRDVAKRKDMVDTKK